MGILNPERYRWLHFANFLLSIRFSRGCTGLSSINLHQKLAGPVFGASFFAARADVVGQAMALLCVAQMEEADRVVVTVVVTGF